MTVFWPGSIVWRGEREANDDNIVLLVLPGSDDPISVLSMTQEYIIIGTATNPYG